MPDPSIHWSRHLTPSEKERHLYDWLNSFTADAGAIEALRPLNELSGVCTVQSCTGHVTDMGDGIRRVESGVIELRLDAERETLWRDAEHLLAKSPAVEDVLTSWRPGYLIFRIEFEPGRLESVARLLALVLDGVWGPLELSPDLEVG